MTKRRRRRMFTAAESAEVWDRWQRGEGLKLIGRVFGRTSSAIFSAPEAAWRDPASAATTIQAGAEPC